MKKKETLERNFISLEAEEESKKEEKIEKPGAREEEEPFKGEIIDYEATSNQAMLKDSRDVSYHEVQNLRSDGKEKQGNQDSEADDEEVNGKHNYSRESSSSDSIPPAPLAPKSNSNASGFGLGFQKTFGKIPEPFEKVQKKLKGNLELGEDCLVDQLENHLSTLESNNAETVKKLETLTREYERKMSSMSDELQAKEERIKRLEEANGQLKEKKFDSLGLEDLLELEKAKREIEKLENKNEKLRAKKNQYKRMQQENNQSVDLQV